MSLIPEISAKDLFERLNRRDRGEENFFLLDVRNENESEICSISGTDFLIPVKSLKKRIGELEGKIPKSGEVIVYCKSGVRSVTGSEILLESDFQKVSHLAGGILSYIRDVDSTLPDY